MFLPSAISRTRGRSGNPDSCSGFQKTGRRFSTGGPENPSGSSNSHPGSTAGLRGVSELPPGGAEQARGKGSAAVDATGEKEQTTFDEQIAKKALLAQIRFFRVRARQKHFFKNPDLLAGYGIGVDPDDSLALLEGWAQTIYDKTATDKLPKVTAAKRAGLKAALDAYKGTQTGQSGAIGTATGTRFDRDALVKQATAGRMWLQFAADAEWPHTDPANYPIRREFQLPASRAFIG